MQFFFFFHFNSLFYTERLNVALDDTWGLSSLRSESKFVSRETLLEIRNPQNIDRKRSGHSLYVALVIIRMRTFKIHVQVTLQWINQSRARCNRCHPLISFLVDILCRRDIKVKYRKNMSRLMYYVSDYYSVFCFRVSRRQLCTFA